MKTQRITSAKRGFSLMELMVAMAITSIIVTVLISITSIAIDTWNRSRSEIRASRQAKAMLDTMARDFETLVTRRGNPNEWLSAETVATGVSSNASKWIFFTASTDRYNGEIGGTNDKGGDVSCVGYLMEYKDPISGGSAENQTFVLNRHVVNPDLTFTNLLGQTSKDTSLKSKFATYDTELKEVKNFVCENIYQFTMSFRIEVIKNIGSESEPKYQTFTAPVKIGAKDSKQTVETFRLLGTGIEAELSDTTINGQTISADEIKAGRIAGVEISITVLSDQAMDLIRKTPTMAQKSDFLIKNSYNFTKLVQLPSM